MIKYREPYRVHYFDKDDKKLVVEAVPIGRDAELYAQHMARHVPEADYFVIGQCVTVDSRTMSYTFYEYGEPCLLNEMVS